jgi:hypothetical protein
MVSPHEIVQKDIISFCPCWLANSLVVKNAIDATCSYFGAIAKAFTKQHDLKEIETVLRDKLDRPDYGVDYITRYYKTTSLWKSLRVFSDSSRCSSSRMATSSPDAINSSLLGAF